MNVWNQPSNIFAPIIAAVPTGTVWSGFGNALIAAAQCVPVTIMPYNVKRPGRFRRETELRHRIAYTATGEPAKPFTVRASLIDKLPDSPAGVEDTHWHLGMTSLKDGLCQPAVPAGFDSALLECSLLRLTQRGQAGASQLALLRHLWASAVLHASAEAIVFGGQHEWRDEWWQETINGEEETRA
jgi:hypothetical protein